MSDGRFSSKPIRGVRSSDFTSSASFGKSDYSADPILSLDATQAFLASPAVQREVNALTDEPLPAIGLLKCAPFPRGTPADAMDLGRPIASAVLQQEYLAGLIFLRIVGWIFLALGLLLILVSVSVMISLSFAPPRPNADRMDPRGAIAIAIVIGAGVTGAGVWFGILRGRVINQMCWFCPHGMVWMTEKLFEWYEWQDVNEVYCKIQTSRLAVGIRFFANISWVSFSNTEASRLIVPYIEGRASAARMPEALQSIAEGRTIHLSGWRLRRSSIHGLTDDVEWKDVIAVDTHDRQFVIRRREGRDVTIALDGMPFPSLFMALALATFAYAREVHNAREL